MKHYISGVDLNPIIIKGISMLYTEFHRSLFFYIDQIDPRKLTSDLSISLKIQAIV